MNEGLIAYRYAKALLGVAWEDKIDKEIYEDMYSLRKVLEQHPEIKDYLASPDLSKKKKNRLLQSIAVHCEKETRRLLSLLVENHREGLLEQVVWFFGEMYREKKNITRINIETPVPITEDFKMKLLKRAGESIQGPIEIYEKINEELLGGYVLEINGFESDCSLATSLKRIAKHGMEKDYKKHF